jgi:hypothetical protein
MTGRGCAIRVDGTLACWGSEGFDDDSDDELSMRAPAGTFTAVTVGGDTACAIRPDGMAVCWGEYDETARPAPTIWFDAPIFVTDRTIPLRWGALPAFGAITAYDLERVTRWDEEGFAVGFEPWRTATSTTDGAVEGAPGEKSCWRARAHDTDGRTSDWTGGCTTLPHDDRGFERSAGWSTVRDKRFYLGRATTTTKRGATLTIDVDAFGLALFARTCRTCGTIRVYDGGDEYTTVSLRTNKSHYRRIVWWGDNGEAGYGVEDDQSGHIVIEVTSSGRPVTIDALLQGPSLDAEGWTP